MLVLGIESSCDETAISIVKNGKYILSNVLYSQIALHKPFGGVYPEIASRSHLEVILDMISKALEEASVGLDAIDLIAVSSSPGLMGSLLVGVNTAKTLAYSLNIPFVGINHIEAHLYAAIMSANRPIFPALGLVISGGHTSLFKIEGNECFTPIGSTIDDAVGEAFDKVARLLGLPYPGGPEIEKLAQKGDPKKEIFKIPKVKNRPFSFSFSGLKTQVLYRVKGQNCKEEKELSFEEKANIAAGFQETALQYLVDESLKALDHFSYDSLYIGGGVSHNQRLRRLFQEKAKDGINLFWPGPGLSLDNAAMVAGLGFHVFQKGQKSDNFNLIPTPTNKCLSFSL